MIMENKCFVYRKNKRDDLMTFLSRITDNDFNGNNQGCINGKGSVIEDILKDCISMEYSVKDIIEDVLVKDYYISSYYKDFKYKIINRRKEVIVSFSYIK